jgi:hypothetical protein
MLRRLAFALTLLAACSVAAAADAAGPTSLSLRPSAYKVLFGHKLTLTGTLGGGSFATVSIMALPYSGSAPSRVATVRTDEQGHFKVAVRPRIETVYQARLDSLQSPTVTVGVMPSTSIRELGNGHIWTHVVVGLSFNRRFVKLQTLTGGTWKTFAQKRLSPAGIAVFSTPNLPTSTVRIFMSVNEAGAGFLATASHPMVYNAHSLTIAAPSTKVLYGRKLVLSGTLQNGRAGESIAIDAWTYGRSAPVRIATVKTGSGGAWSLAVRPSIQTAYRASWGSNQRSNRIIIGVKPVVTIRELGNGHVFASIDAGRPLTNKKVKLQQQTAGGIWLTVAQRALNAKSATVFALPLPAASIRVALSVNQAGAGLLGTMSHALAYHAA